LRSNSWKQTALLALRRTGDPGPLRHVAEVSGGSISRAFRLVTDQNTYFFKGHGEAPPGFFAAEARGLKRLGRAAKTVRIPQVFEWDGPEKRGKGWILMEWIESDLRGSSSKQAAEKLGRGLAEIHRTTAEAFGLDEDNYIGILPQPNGWYKSWTDFYRERRLLPQIRLAAERGLLPRRRGQLLHRLCNRLERWLDRPDLRPSLLHGDLWNGNVLWGHDGRTWLIDPASYFGHREVDLAMLTLFGLPQLERVLAAYDEAHPLAEGWRERLGLHQVFPLLVHAVLFGHAYGARAAAIAARHVTGSSSEAT